MEATEVATAATEVTTDRGKEISSGAAEETATEIASKRADVKAAQKGRGRVRRFKFATSSVERGIARCAAALSDDSGPENG
jgi:hypothetical protein